MTFSVNLRYIIPALVKVFLNKIVLLSSKGILIIEVGSSQSFSLTSDNSTVN